MITITQIIDIVSKSTNIDKDIIISTKKCKSSRNIAVARSLVLKFAKEYTLMSNEEISQALNLTTQWAYYSVNIINDMLEGYQGHDNAIKIIKLIEEIEKQIKEI